jgi:stalled ribosome rescue protein Dom34
VTIACCHHLFHSTTSIEKGDGIIDVTFFATKQSKRQRPSKEVMKVTIVFFFSKHKKRQW